MDFQPRMPMQSFTNLHANVPKCAWKPELQGGTRPGNLSSFIVNIVVWTRLDGSSPNNRSTSASRAINASNAKTHDTNVGTASPSPAPSSTQGMGIRALWGRVSSFASVLQAASYALVRAFWGVLSARARGSASGPVRGTALSPCKRWSAQRYQ